MRRFSLILLFLLCACNKTPLANGTIEIQPQTGPAVNFNIKYARTEEQQEYGLMFVKQMPENQGMLFVFQQPQPLKFWMKNTLIPLDVLFFDEHKKLIYITPNRKPQDLTPLGTDDNALYVLEINGGEAQKYNIHIGDSLKIDK